MRIRERAPKRGKLISRELMQEQLEPVLDIRAEVPAELAEKLRGHLVGLVKDKETLVKNENEFYHTLETFHLLFPDQAVGFTREQRMIILGHLASLKPSAKDFQKMGWYMVRLAMALPEFPELRTVQPAEWWRLGPLKKIPGLTQVEINDWVTALSERPQMQNVRLGDKDSAFLAKSAVVFNAVQPSQIAALRRQAQRILTNGVARHGFALPSDVLRIEFDLRLTFPDLEFPFQPNEKEKEHIIRTWKEAVKKPEGQGMDLYTHTGSALFVTTSQLRVDEQGKVRYTLRPPQVQKRSELPERASI